ncbi:MAG: DNA mismatch repair protein MutS, partial [Firmicutes bacterium]|nr:DNA mismatch repair protein MutS [Bacillota bacterium]
AWSAAEYLCREDRRIRTLFATHYHEMTALKGTLKGIKNYNVDVSDENGEVVFLHKIVEGPASRSYGIHVAKLAGVPLELLRNARQRLEILENGKETPVVKTETAKEEEAQLSFFDAIPDPVVQKLRSLDLMDTTPSEALKILENLQELLK